jgi:hypothetical protein
MAQHFCVNSRERDHVPEVDLARQEFHPNLTPIIDSSCD